MKLNLQRILIVIIACLGLFFSGCEKEEINTEQKIEIKNKFTDHDYLKTLQEDSFFAGAINDFNNYITYEKSSSSNNFKIVEGSVRIERGIGYTTYVLLLENQTNKKNYFENLVIQTALNKPIRYLLFKYDLQKSFNNQFLNDKEHGLFPNMKISQLNVVSNSLNLMSNKGGVL
jgi:hypothetical protein